METGILFCWHAERAGITVLEQSIKALANRKIKITEVLYLLQSGTNHQVPSELHGAMISKLEIPLSDPTDHSEIYTKLKKFFLPRLGQLKGTLHLNVSPGTPAMHSVWLVLFAGGALPNGTKIWSSQLNKDTNRVRISHVQFPITTYLAEIRRTATIAPNVAFYEPEAHSIQRHQAFDKLARYARVKGSPLLILGERGIGKTRLVETYISHLKDKANVVTIACGGLDTALSDSTIFGHVKGAFTGATESRVGLLAKADKGILFLDEVQDLPKQTQRKLVRVFQERTRRYRQLGSDEELTVDVDLVCASNLSLSVLRERLDADLFDRLSHLIVEIPPLRECRADLEDDWKKVWRELCISIELPSEAPWNHILESALKEHPLDGNLRDLQRLASLIMAWWTPNNQELGIKKAINEWNTLPSVDKEQKAYLGQGTRNQRIQWFRGELARWAKNKYLTWANAAKALGCDEKTLRLDEKHTNT